eukprot:13208422-Alexandrium_andersonii.AAC.1
MNLHLWRAGVAKSIAAAAALLGRCRSGFGLRRALRHSQSICSTFWAQVGSKWRAAMRLMTPCRSRAASAGGAAPDG